MLLAKKDDSSTAESTLYERTHVAMRAPLSRHGGLNRYVRNLAMGQVQLGLSAAAHHSVTSAGRSEVEVFGATRTTQPLDSRVVHFHMAHSARPFLRSPLNAATLKHADLVMHFHGPWWREGRVQGDNVPRSMAKWIYEASTYRRFRGHIAASKSFAGILARHYRVPKKRIEVVYPGVDTQKFQALSATDSRVQLGMDPSRPYALCVRRLEPRMGIDVAIRSVANLDDVTLIVAGVGSLEASLKGLASELGISHRVEFHGSVLDENLPLLYSAADVTLVPSLALEGFGMTVLESFACGTPVIGSRVGGLPEALGPYADNWSVEPGSIEALREKIRDALQAGEPAGDLRRYAESRSAREMAASTESILSSWTWTGA